MSSYPKPNEFVQSTCTPMHDEQRYAWLVFRRKQRAIFQQRQPWIPLLEVENSWSGIVLAASRILKFVSGFPREESLQAIPVPVCDKTAKAIEGVTAWNQQTWFSLIDTLQNGTSEWKDVIKLSWVEWSNGIFWPDRREKANKYWRCYNE